MVKLLVEIQASHVGIGKSILTEKLGYPWVDDCISLVESDPFFFYGSKGDVYEDEADNEKLRAYLTLEHSAALLDQLSKNLGKNWTIVASRSPLISCVQFAKYDIDWKLLADYYKKRIDHLKVDHVLILDYGSSIQADERFLKTAYDRMLLRGRWFELNAFDSFDTYCKFFEKAEKKKQQIVEMYEADPYLFTYKDMPFNNFDKSDIQGAKQIIADFEKDLDEFLCP